MRKLSIPGQLTASRSTNASSSTIPRTLCPGRCHHAGKSCTPRIAPSRRQWAHHQLYTLRHFGLIASSEHSLLRLSHSRSNPAVPLCIQHNLDLLGHHSTFIPDARRTTPSHTWHSVFNSPSWNDKSATSTLPCRPIRPARLLCTFPAQGVVQLTTQTSPNTYQLKQCNYSNSRNLKRSLLHSDVPTMDVSRSGLEVCVFCMPPLLFSGTGMLAADTGMAFCCAVVAVACRQY